MNDELYKDKTKIRATKSNETFFDIKMKYAVHDCLLLCLIEFEFMPIVDIIFFNDQIVDYCKMLPFKVPLSVSLNL